VLCCGDVVFVVFVDVVFVDVVVVPALPALIVSVQFIYFVTVKVTTVKSARKYKARWIQNIGYYVRMTGHSRDRTGICLIFFPFLISSS
jgi:hypothetical protein